VAPDADQRALLYVTAGVAWADADGTLYTSGRASSTTNPSFSFDDAGGVIGGGVEWAASQSLRVRAEGLYYWFDDRKDLFAACPNNTNGCSSANPGEFFEFEDVYVFRLGASYYFNAPPPPAHVSMK
jgi:opacity protein-like surface antigen